MTTEEAIRILDPETTAEALEEIEYYAGFSGKTAKIQAVTRACEIAISVMRNKNEIGKNGPNSPCDLCMYNPPSSRDGKPCGICPAVGKEQKND